MVKLILADHGKSTALKVNNDQFGEINVQAHYITQLLDRIE